METCNEPFELLRILFVSHGSNGSHLLFKYPFTDSRQQKNLAGSIFDAFTFDKQNEVYYIFGFFKQLATNAVTFRSRRMKTQTFGSQKSKVNKYCQNFFRILIAELNLTKKTSLGGDVLAGLCVANKEKLELRIDNVVFLCSQSILNINKGTFNIVFALKVHF